MGAGLLMTLVGIMACLGLVSGVCYSYNDHAAHYKLDPLAQNYPWDEVDVAMKQHPGLSEIMATGTKVSTSRPPGFHYYEPVSVPCPSDRIMLKAFTVDGDQCWVVKPEVQQLRYTRCNGKYNRACQSCSSAHQGGVNKCEEDYEWMTVWAYCKKVYTPQPNPYPHPNPYPNPTPYYPKPAVVYPQPHPKPVYRPSYPTGGSKGYYPTRLYAKSFYNDPHSRRWKRSPLTSSFTGKIEKISLYLPYQCSCKTYKC